MVGPQGIWQIMCIFSAVYIHIGIHDFLGEYQSYSRLADLQKEAY